MKYYIILFLTIIPTSILFGQSFDSDTLGIYYAQSIEEQLYRDCSLDLSKNQEKILTNRLILVYDDILEKFPNTYFKPYIFNKLGTLYKYQNDLSSSEMYYKRVTKYKGQFSWEYRLRVLCSFFNESFFESFTIDNVSTLKHDSFLNLSRIEILRNNYRSALVLLDSTRNYPQNIGGCFSDEYPHYKERTTILYALKDFKKLNIIFKDAYLSSFFIPKEKDEITYKTIINNYTKEEIYTGILKPIKDLSIKKSLDWFELKITFMDKEEYLDLDIFDGEEEYKKFFLKEDDNTAINYEDIGRKVIKNCKKSYLYRKLKKYTIHNKN
ncbi:hypothetical protein EI427_21130 [Flammeovirga pectinis]|uniref:Tetratricopeptide repeat protein n=1 Tax=Flammeovirga pectinis TaxID=2494373 RepID=A0A3Q9FTK0_9BACT|nr:hypothetical protein [Flammeovirga pectinis]AZQ64730.1 hypothetical protein EI427_21130 [Flammeovirga pectinis]